jgi:hypothetical protein
VNHPVPLNRKIVGILQPGYLPWLGFFEQLYSCDVFVLYDDVQFEKGSWRNRNRIKSPQGPVWLTVPVLLKGRGFPLIKDVKINSSIPWSKKHIKTITQNYAKAPFFEAYCDGFFAILERPFKYLIDLDLELISWLAYQLNITTPMVLSSELAIHGSRTQRLIDIIRTLDGNVFYEGSAGSNYINVDEFRDAGIDVVFQDYQHPVYPQLYGDFVSHLSTLDLLLNCGREGLKILSEK